MHNEQKMEKIVSLAKRKGFIYPSSLIYGGIAGFWDYGPLGVELKRNLEDLWWKTFVSSIPNIYGLDASLVMNRKVWEASGHTEGFADPTVICKECGKSFRADHLKENKCPDCGGGLGDEKQFNMMFETRVGATQDEDSKTYLRPETAQGIFVNFKNVLDSFSPKIPFGIAQIGKAFRNEISPRDFVFRSREFTQMEIEYFIEEKNWEKEFENWLEFMREWIEALGLKGVKEIEVLGDDLAHYSKKTIDFEYEFPFGEAELYGLAYRTDYDLKKHSEKSGEDLSYRPVEGEPFIPHVIEPTFGVDRTILALLSEHYNENEERGIWLSLPYKLAPYKIAVFPLLRNKPELIEKAQSIFAMLKKNIPEIVWDDNGNVGKRYRRQDEIGTPFCVTVDFETLEDSAVTVRDRDTMEQERVTIENLAEYLNNKLNV